MRHTRDCCAWQDNSVGNEKESIFTSDSVVFPGMSSRGGAVGVSSSGAFDSSTGTKEGQDWGIVTAQVARGGGPPTPRDDQCVRVRDSTGRAVKSKLET